MKKLYGRCPVCESKLHINRLACPQCKAEYPMDEGLSPYEYLDEGQKKLLETFLKYKGNIKAVESEMNMSYSTFNKRYDELLITLGLKEETAFEMEEIDMSLFGKINRNSKDASEIIKNKLYDNKGSAIIYLQKGDACRIYITQDGEFSSDKLSNQPMSFKVFDVIVDFLKENGGEAPKGLGRSDRVGYGKCGEETIMYQIATKYYGKKKGESTFDPVFVLAAMLEWAGIAKNGRGYLSLL